MKTAVVTGCRSGGIGQAISRRLSRCDCHVTVIEKDERAGAQAVKQLRDEGLNVELKVANLTGPDQVREVLASLASLDILVNNAGHAGSPAFDNLADSTPESFDELIRCNLTSAYLVTKEAVERFFVPQQRGRVIFVGSNNGAMGLLGQLAYGAAKQALAALPRILAAEYAGTGITFNCVSPGIIETDGPNWRVRRTSDPLWTYIERFQNPTRRLGRPEDVAALVAFLVSDEASFINGVDIAIDGGLRATGVMFPDFKATNARQSYVDLFRPAVEAKLAEAQPEQVANHAD